MAETPTPTDVFEAFVRLRLALSGAQELAPPDNAWVYVPAEDLRAVLQVPWDYVTDEATLRKAIDAFNAATANSGLTFPLHRSNPYHLAAMRAAITTLLGGDKK